MKLLHSQPVGSWRTLCEYPECVMKDDSPAVVPVGPQWAIEPRKKEELLSIY